MPPLLGAGLALLTALAFGLGPALHAARAKPIESLKDEGHSATVLGLFAALAVALAAVGIYATISLLVVQRAHEIGIRMALGARENGIVRMMLAQSLGLTALGVGFGLAGSPLLTRVLNTMVYGVGTLDPVTFASVPLGLGLVALVACVITGAARRGARPGGDLAARVS